MQLIKLIRGTLVATVGMTAVLGAGAATADAWSPSQPTASSVAKTTNVPVAMSDGDGSVPRRGAPRGLIGQPASRPLSGAPDPNALQQERRAQLRG